MNSKQFEEIINAIFARKYSWACVLILRVHGYDPLQYIPYRTYIRLLKENHQCQGRKKDNNQSLKVQDINSH
ncbi:MAG: HetP family heterocyst commitment protein [Nostocaceae cyanobacterium]|nr:HetP family heterocyst commitment protein [Nostocaceae cyanobacterium]